MRWVDRMSRAMGQSESHAPLRSWCRESNAVFVVPVMPGVTLTVIVPNGTTLQAAKKMALDRLAPAIAIVQTALVAYTSVERQAHIVFVAEKTFPRSLPTTVGDPIEPRHINGGVTTFGADPSSEPWRIMVYRWSDALKVVIHELVHLHELDVLQEDPRAEASFMARHRIALEPPIKRLAIQESLTEVIAFYVLSIMTAVATGKPWDAVASRIGLESDVLASRFVAHFPGYSLGDITKNTKNTKNTKTPRSTAMYRDGTHSYAYVIARAAIWTDVDTLIRALEARRIRSTKDLLAIITKREAALFDRIGRTSSPTRARAARSNADLRLSPIQ